MLLSTRTIPAPNDVDLLGRMATGDTIAAGQLYDRYVGQLYAVAYRVMGNRAAAEEIVHETLTQASRYADQALPTSGTVATWLITMAHSRALEAVRERGGRPRLTPTCSNYSLGGSLALIHQPAGYTVEPEHPEARSRIDAALRRVTPHQREVLALALHDRLSPTQMAQRLSVPLPTITDRLQLGMQKLSEVLRMAPPQQATGRKPSTGSR
ncbi:MAG: sigma-70 family RNA polymerase sigma factor [Gemmatimonadota bacterium]